MVKNERDQMFAKALAHPAAVAGTLVFEGGLLVAGLAVLASGMLESSFQAFYENNGRFSCEYVVWKQRP